MSIDTKFLMMLVRMWGEGNSVLVGVRARTAPMDMSVKAPQKAESRSTSRSSCTTCDGLSKKLPPPQVSGI